MNNLYVDPPRPTFREPSCFNLNAPPRGEAIVRSPTSEFLDEVSVPTALCLSSRIVLVPDFLASCRAIANPTTPPPMTYPWDTQLVTTPNPGVKI